MGVTITFDHLPEILAKLEPAVAKAMDDYAAKVREEAQANMPRATGSAADGLYVVSALRNEYSSAASKAQGDNPRVEILPEVGTPQGSNAVVAGAAAHTAAVELGSIHMPARPSLVPALENHKSELLDALVKVFS